MQDCHVAIADAIALEEDVRERRKPVVHEVVEVVVVDPHRRGVRDVGNVAADPYGGDVAVEDDGRAFRVAPRLRELHNDGSPENLLRRSFAARKLHLLAHAVREVARVVEPRDAKLRATPLGLAENRVVAVDVHHVVETPADFGFRDLDASLRVDEKDGIRRERDVRTLVRAHVVPYDPDVLAHLGHDAHRDAAADIHIGNLHVAAVRERHHRPRAPAAKQQAERLVQRERTLPGVLRMGVLEVAEEHLPAAAVLRRHGIERGGERVLVALALGRGDVLDVAVAERVHRDLALARIRAALVHVEEYLAVLRLVRRAPLRELAEEPLVVLLRDRELHERQTEHARREVSDLHAVASLHHERERIAMEHETRAAAVHRHVLQPLKVHDHLLHARRAAHGGEEMFLRPLLEEMVLALGEPERVPVLEPRHRRADGRRGVPLDRSHLNDRASRFRDNRSSLDASGNKSYCNKQILFHDNMKPIL